MSNQFLLLDQLLLSILLSFVFIWKERGALFQDDGCIHVAKGVTGFLVGASMFYCWSRKVGSWCKKLENICTTSTSFSQIAFIACSCMLNALILTLHLWLRMWKKPEQCDRWKVLLRVFLCLGDGGCLVCLLLVVRQMRYTGVVVCICCLALSWLEW